MLARILALVLVMVCAVPAVAGGGRARALLCRQSCGTAIATCVEATGRLRRCKRQVIRRCKRGGLSVCAPPETYAVTTNGSDTPGCGAADAPCRTIQFVVDQRVPRDGAGVVRLAAGTYDGVASCPAGGSASPAVVCVVNKRITLLGGFVPPNWDTPSDDPGATRIDAQGAGRGVHVVRGGEVGPTTSLVVDGVTIQNGVAVGAASGPLAERSAFGGGLYAQHSALTLRNVVFRDNEARGAGSGQDEGGRGAGGALVAYSGWASVLAPAMLEHVTFAGNRAVGSSGAAMGGYALGGAMFTHSIAVTGDDVVFTDNTATGGPTDGVGTNGTEKADALGGALAVGIHGVVELRNVQATGNGATGGAAPNGEAGGAYGGAVFVEKGALTVADSRFEGNRAMGGAGMNITVGGSIAQGGALQTLNSSLTLDRALVIGNEARAGDGVVNGGVADGGGVAMILGAFEDVTRPFTIRNTVVADNGIVHGAGARAVGAGGGVFVNGATGTVEHATVADNRLGDPNDVGGGIAALPVPGWETHVTVVDSIVANHRSVGLDPRAYANAGLWVAEGGSADVTRVLFANNRHDSNANIDDPFNLPPGAFTLSGVATAADAGFAGPADYHLGPGSPAIDQAVGSSMTVDGDGTLRPAGAAPDLGAYERVP
ncbi:MAG TPA: choice-of-anchor Q domain-containing protein [Candidatus Binatia bacterium]|jgi:hypothetical protein|nr:choice-of-anchor Q domain-containing protein [Candidatus Binatia bacterium]